MDELPPPVPPHTPALGVEEKPTGGGSVPPAPATRAQGSSSLEQVSGVNKLDHLLIKNPHYDTTYGVLGAAGGAGVGAWNGGDPEDSTPTFLPPTHTPPPPTSAAGVLGAAGGTRLKEWSGGDPEGSPSTSPPPTPPPPTQAAPIEPPLSSQGVEEEPTGGSGAPPAPTRAHGRAQGSSLHVKVSRVLKTDSKCLIKNLTHDDVVAEECR